MTVLTALSGLFAIAGIVLVLLLVRVVKHALNASKLQPHRYRGEGTADLLNWAALVDDGIVVGKDGSLLAAWRYRCPDTASSTEAEQEHLSASINRALQPLGSGWVLHVDAVRRPAPSYGPQAAFPDPITAAIDAERRTYFEARGTMFESEFVVTATFLPPALIQSRFVELFFDDQTQTASGSASDETVAAFKRELRALEARMPASFKLERLRSRNVQTEHGEIVQDELLCWLQYCATGVLQAITLPRNPVYLDQLIGGQDLWGGVVPKIGRHFIQTVSIDGLPTQSYPAMLGVLAELPCEYRWSTRFIALDPHQAVAQLERYRKKWKQKIRGMTDQLLGSGAGSVDHDAVDMVRDAEAAISDVNSGVVGQGYYTSLIVLMDPDRDRLQRLAEQTYRVLLRLGFGARVEDVNTLEAWLGSLPGHAVQNVRRPLVNTFNLADLLPASSIWAGENAAPCPFYPVGSGPLLHCVTTGATPFRLNLHVRDVGHTLMFGPTGAGKSTQLTFLAAQLRRYAGMQIFAFDKGLSLYPLCSAIRSSTGGRSGLHFAVGTEGSPAFAPLQFLESRADRAWASEWVDIVLGLNGHTSTAEQRNEIAAAIASMHATASTSITDLMLTLQDQQLREVLEPYTVRGTMGHLFDAVTDELALSDFTTFEIEELMGLGDKFALPILWYLFRRIERSLDGRPAAILLDEAWLLLGHPVFREKIREWLKVLRKSNCLVLLATQSLSDASRSGILDVLVESCSTKIFLPNPNAREDSAAPLYKSMGLNDRQIEILASATPKKHYYYVSEQGRRLYELALGPFALAFCGASGREDLATIRALQRQWGDDWVAHWLEHRAVQPVARRAA